jgi:Zn-dependent M28 family amino/carboxypeptidase
LPFRVKAHMVNLVRPFDSENVLAMVPGSDPKLKDQAVLYSAHWDHLGIRQTPHGVDIYHGAIDNATGCAVLMEMARAYARSAVKPKRSIIFAAVTGEEQGLRGSEYLGKHLPVPAANVTLALNFDGVAPYGVPEEIEAAGAERTTFYPTLEKVAQSFNLAIAPDSNPSAGFYYRSDHFSLARVGIPAFSVGQGRTFEGHPREWGESWAKEFTAKHYHQPSDEYHADWDFRGNAKMARFGVALGWQAANTEQLIGWQPGDEFDRARKASLTVNSGTSIGH